MTTPASLPMQLKSRDANRLRTYREHLAFYNGDQWATGRTVRNRRNERRLTYNYAEAFLNKSASYMMSGIAFTAEPIDDSAEAAANAAAAEEALRQVAEQNELDALDFDTELDCSVLGDGAYKVTWDADNERVRVTAPDVTALWAWFRPDGDDMWRVAHRYELDATDALALYGLRSERARATLIEDWTAQTYTLWLNNEIAETRDNPYGFVPYVIYPNIRRPKEQWGTSDIPAIREAAREVNRTATQLSQIMELSGNPIAVLENVTESADIGVAPGAVWEIPENAKAYLLDLLKDGGARLMLDYMAEVKRTLHDLAEMPATSFGENTRGLSGVALNVQLDPVVKKIARKRLIRGRALTKRNAMILALLGQFAGLDQAIATHTTSIGWADVLPNDEAMQIANETALVNAAIHSRNRAASALGVDDPDAELAQWLAEAKAISAVQPTQAPTPQRADTGAR